MASTSFPTALAFVLKVEGDFVHHPADPGGATRFGITEATLARARRSAASVEDVRALQSDEAARIYRGWYWNAIRGDDLPPGLDLAVFDIAVNSGPGRAARLLQAALSVPADGIVGPVTLDAARRSDRVRTIRALTELRLGFLSGLSAWPIFGRGWKRRTLRGGARSPAARRRPDCPSTPDGDPHDRHETYPDQPNGSGEFRRTCRNRARAVRLRHLAARPERLRRSDGGAHRGGKFRCIDSVSDCSH